MNPAKRICVTIEDSDVQNVRIDTYIAEHLMLFPRSQLKQRSVQLMVNGKDAKLSKRISTGDSIEVIYGPLPEVSFEPEDIPLDIIFENDLCIVINKRRGVVVHPAAGNHHGTLVQGLLFHCAALRDEFLDTEIRPGIVHRLDKETTGVLIAAKTRRVQEMLALQFRDRTVKKKYYALVKGAMFSDSGVIDAPLGRDPHNRKRFKVLRSGGKPARTTYRVLKRFERYSFIAAMPETGRTHQIRVHLQSVGAPIVGDTIYSRANPHGAPLMLHAYSLMITLPGENEPRTFRAPLPDDFRSAFRRVG